MVNSMITTVVAYFSATGTTKKVAEHLAKELKSDLFEIEPKEKYTQQDLNWNDKTSRTSLEGANIRIRPEIENKMDISCYSIIYLGFPIWWYRAPNIINSFLEQYDFSNKTIKIFATSGGSGFADTIKYLKTSVSNTCVIEEYKIFR